MDVEFAGQLELNLNTGIGGLGQLPSERKEAEEEAKKVVKEAKKIAKEAEAHLIQSAATVPLHGTAFLPGADASVLNLNTAAGTVPPSSGVRVVPMVMQTGGSPLGVGVANPGVPSGPFGAQDPAHNQIPVSHSTAAEAREVAKGDTNDPVEKLASPRVRESAQASRASIRKRLQPAIPIAPQSYPPNTAANIPPNAPPEVATLLTTLAPTNYTTQFITPVDKTVPALNVPIIAIPNTSPSGCMTLRGIISINAGITGSLEPFFKTKYKKYPIFEVSRQVFQV